MNTEGADVLPHQLDHCIQTRAFDPGVSACAGGPGNAWGGSYSRTGSLCPLEVIATVGLPGGREHAEPLVFSREAAPRREPVAPWKPTVAES